MITFVRGRAVKLNNNKSNGIQFLRGHSHPILGQYIPKYSSTWKIYIS